MRTRYPIFLSKNPSFLGLEITDLFLVGVGLVLAFTLKLSSLIGFISTVVLIGIRIITSKFIDLKGLFYGLGIRDQDLSFKDITYRRDK